MRNTNRLLIRLNKAVDCSNSKYLSERALAVILFDNLIETHLYHLLTYNMFINKNSNGLDLYRYSHRQIKNYEDILKYAKKENLIDAFEQKILKFAHKQRNKIYHENQFIQNDIELSIILYYIFISKKRDGWEKAASFRIYSSNIDDEQINFGQGLIEEAFPFDHKKYYFKTWDYILQKWKIRRNFAKTCKRNILNQIKRIQHSSKYLKKTLKEYNYLYDTEYYSFVKEKDKEDCRNIDFILLVHMYYRLISEDTKCRKELLSIRDFTEKNNKVYPKWVDINKIKERVEKFKNLTDEKIFDNYVEIETRIFDLYQDSYDAMCYLDGYIQYLVDQYRGK